MNPAAVPEHPDAVGATARIVPLQALRGLAAVSVAVYHAAHFTAQRTGAAWLEQVFSGRLGLYGVLVFFVLSGYLMESAVRRYDAGTFVLHRFLRLYPSYWLIFLGYFLLQGGRLGQFDALPWKALTLLPLGEMYRPLHVEWTLLYEVFFYLVCTALCFFRRAVTPVMVAWLLLVAVAVFRFHQYGTAMQPTFAQIPFSAWNVGFICGVLAGRVAQRGVTAAAPWLLLSSVVLVALAECVGPAEGLFLASPGMACLVLALAAAPVGPPRTPGLLMRTAFVVGECSYGIYLAHSLAIQIALQETGESGLTHPVSVFASVLAVGLAIGLLAGVADLALYRRLKRWADRRSRPMAPGLAEPAP